MFEEVREPVKSKVKEIERFLDESSIQLRSGLKEKEEER